MNSYTDRNQPPSEYQENLEILMQIPVFSGLPVDARKLLAYLCTRETFKAEEYLFTEGDIDENAYYILEGKAGLLLPVDGGNETIREYGESSFLGGMSLLCPSKRLFSLKAVTKVRCMILSRSKFQRILDQFPEIAASMIEELCQLIHRWETRTIAEHVNKCPECKKSVGITLL